MGNDSHKYKILLVDDDEGSLNVLRLEFLDDYLVLLARDGDEALEIISRAENSDIAVIITDQKMPITSGIDFLEKSIARHQDAIRIIITAYPNIDAKKAINSAGIDKLFFKPLEDKMTVELKNYVKEAVGKYELKVQNRQICNQLRELISNNINIRRLFSKYLPAKIIRLLEKKNQLDLIPPGDSEKREVSILYADICGFTSMCEQMSPEKIVQFLNNYLSAMSDVIKDNNGIIDKYIGDAIMATFGVIESSSTDALKALKCAFKMKEALIELNKKSNPEIHFGIGINTGEVVVGNIGSEYRWDYTIIGEAVNMTVRIEHLTRESQIKDTILIGEETFKKTIEIIEEYKKWESKKVKGFQKAIQVYEVLKLKDLG